MGRYSRITRNDWSTASIVLIVLLALISFGMAYAISNLQKIGLLIPVLLIGLGIAVFSVMYPLFGIYVIIIISFFVFDVMRFFRTEMPLVTLIDVLIYVVFLGVLVNKIVKKERFWDNQRNPIVSIHIVLIVYLLLQAFNPNGVSVVLFFSMSKRLISLYIFFYCVLQLFRDYHTIRQFFVIWVGLAFITGIYGCYQQWFGLPKFELDYITSNPLRMALSALPNGDYRKSSFLAGCNEFGLVMAGTAIIVLTFLLKAKTTRFKKSFLYISVVIMVLGMSYSGTRTATFMLTVEVVLYILMTINEKKTLLFGCFFSLLFVGILMAPSYGNVTLNRVKSTFQISTDESLNVRDVNRKAIQPYIYSHPVGGGVGSTGVLNAEFNDRHPLAGFPTDSGLLALTLEVGWIGLLLQCVAYFFILQQGINGYYRSKHPEIKVLFLASTLCVFGFVFAQYSQMAIGPIPGAFLYYGLAAAIIRLQELEQKSKPILNNIN